MTETTETEKLKYIFSLKNIAKDEHFHFAKEHDKEVKVGKYAPDSTRYNFGI
jgi:nucleoside-triphosphatase THEP1